MRIEMVLMAAAIITSLSTAASQELTAPEPMPCNSWIGSDMEDWQCDDLHAEASSAWQVATKQIDSSGPDKQSRMAGFYRAMQNTAFIFAGPSDQTAHNQDKAVGCAFYEQILALHPELDRAGVVLAADEDSYILRCSSLNVDEIDRKRSIRRLLDATIG